MILTWVEVKEGIILALASLKANKLRSGLTILGVMVGVGSVIAMASIVDGLDGAVKEDIDAQGVNTIIVDRFPPNTNYHDLSKEERKRPYMEVGEAMAIRGNCPHVDGVAPMNHWWQFPEGNEVKYMNRKGNNPAIMGTWPDFMKVKNASMEAGRFISDLDLQFRRTVCVLGNDLARALFEEEDPVGAEIRVNNNRFEVVGVLAKQESNFNQERDNNKVILPLTTYEKIHPWDEALTLWVRSNDIESMELAIEEVISALRIHRRVAFNEPNNFYLGTQESQKEMVEDITKWLYLAAIIITSVGLMVGGIGVMNIMLVSVTERTREIGVRKAIGAKRSNILMQFLTEATTLSGTGGVIGIAFGVLIGMGINVWAGFPLSISLFWVVLGFVVAVSVGLISGVYPAMKAARLDPIEALRYE
ncbi:MAG: ABC transporter permease [Candidatus Zixiibacteriota bacterium]|nr:MAG: ABC transporter permease [candidate division Zixibacteria bacterium]